MSSVPDGRAAYQPLLAMTLMPPIAAPLPGALTSTLSIFSPASSLAPSCSGVIKVIAKSGWYAARPSGTEDIYKIYAESFSGAEHLQRILNEAQAVVDRAIGAAAGSEKGKR